MHGGFSATAERLVFITPSPIGERSIVMSVSVCVSVRDHSELHVRSSSFFCKCYLRPWLGPPLAA